MHQLSSITKSKHILFIQRVVEFEKVWGLESEDGFATSSSNDDEEENIRSIILFWSDKAYAKALAKEDWIDYYAREMTLSEFLENWLVGMYNDNFLVGTNWDANMFGVESEPLLLALEILAELRKKNRAISFSKYNDLDDFESQILSVIE